MVISCQPLDSLNLPVYHSDITLILLSALADSRVWAVGGVQIMSRERIERDGVEHGFVERILLAFVVIALLMISSWKAIRRIWEDVR